MEKINFDKLFEIAKYSILYYLKNRDFPFIDDNSEKRATFVTLKKNGELRGCIGEIIPQLSLKKSVSKNAISAAFFDPRFPPISEEELNSTLDIEISILSPIYEFNGSLEEFIKFIDENKCGVVLEYNGYSATFLPSVWKEIQNPEQFLIELCYKAGFDPKYLDFAKKYYYFTESKMKNWDEI